MSHNRLCLLFVVGACMLSMVLAFQAPPRVILSGVSAPSLTSRLWMDAASSRPFVLPLLQDVDWIHGFRDRISHPSVKAAAPVGERLDEDDVLLEYLPWFVLPQTPKPKQLIAQATRQYVYGDTRNDPPVNVTDVLQAIRQEYKCSDVPVTIGEDVTLSSERNRKHLDVVHILSFAAYHRLPQQVTAILFGGQLEEFKDLFLRKNGWSAVSFPRGLAIRLPRNRLTSRLDRYQPIPRRFLLAHNVKVAARAVKEASQTEAPVQRLLSRQAFLQSLEKEMMAHEAKRRRSIINRKKRRTGIPLLCDFPSKHTILRFARTKVAAAQRFWKTSLTRVKQSLRAMLLSYGLLAFVWYTVSLFWRWQRLSVTAFLSTSAMRSSLHRIGGILAQTYSSLRLPTNLSLMFILAAMTPVAHKLLVFTKNRLGVANETQALLVVGSTLALSHVCVGASILFLDAAILRSMIWV